ncbi:hypothetical protein MRX96_006498 [Rhipicephalus microplus]
MRFASEDIKPRYQDVVTAREMWSSQRLPSFLIAGGVQRRLQRRIPERVCRIATACNSGLPAEVETKKRRLSWHFEGCRWWCARRPRNAKWSDSRAVLPTETQVLNACTRNKNNVHGVG